MDNIALNMWLSIGVLFVLAEAILPGLVSVFVGLGALTVAACIHYGIPTDIDFVVMQLLVWFGSSIFYISSLRLLVMKYYPSDTLVTNIDEEGLAVGGSAVVVEAIRPEKDGRIKFRESTWRAVSSDRLGFSVGNTVRLVKRSNISWEVERIPE